MSEAVIVSAARTAIGNFGGSLKDFNAGQLGAFAVKEAIKRAGIETAEIDEVILGNVLSAGQGMNVARQAALGAGVPKEVPAYGINKVCGSGLKSIQLAAQAIRAGDAEIIIAGGTESMSTTPYALKQARWGIRMGNAELLDLMISDGLTDIFNNYHMGVTAENLAEKFSITRDEQDAFSAASQQKAEAAIKGGKFKEEIVPVSIPQRKSDPVVFDTDEFPKSGTTKESLAKLRPAFKKDGTVTAGNASGINDGAAAVVVMSEERAKKLGLKIIAHVRAYGASGVSPEIMGIGPVDATKKALKNAGLTHDKLDVVEANEAFASQAIAVNKELGWDTKKINFNGGAIALGHPIGASGARIFVSLLYEMQRQNAKHGLATLCIGGGQGIAVVVDR